MVNANHTNASRERIIATQQTSGAQVPLNRLLNNEVYVALSLIKNGHQARKPDMVKRGETKLNEAREQLMLLAACEFIPQVDAANLQKAIEAFEAETEQARAALAAVKGE